MVRIHPSKRKVEVMRSKHFLLLSALLFAGTSNAAFAQHARLGGARKAYAVDSGSYFWLHSKHRFWKQQCGRIGWNSNRAHKSQRIRSSIRHEPLRDGCRPVRVTDIRQTIPGLRLRSIDATRSNMAA